MPELPEVETVIRTLKPQLMGRRIEAVEVLLPKIVKEPDPAEFEATLSGLSVTGLERQGKFILIRLEEGWLLVVHLRMTGRLVVADPEAERDKYTHVIFTLDDGHELRFRDMRQFGTMHLIPAAERPGFLPLARLGPDALDPQLTKAAFRRLFPGKKREIKSLLLDQCFVAGLGNIYANELLWQAGVRPQRRAGTLSEREIDCLYQAMREILARAIDHRGTTLRDYVDGNGKPGGFQGLLSVHGREGEPCPRCGREIVRVKCGGRSAFYCPDCQK